MDVTNYDPVDVASMGFDRNSPAACCVLGTFQLSQDER